MGLVHTQFTHLKPTYAGTPEDDQLGRAKTLLPTFYWYCLNTIMCWEFKTCLGEEDSCHGSIILLVQLHSRAHILWPCQSTTRNSGLSVSLSFPTLCIQLRSAPVRSWLFLTIRINQELSVGAENNFSPGNMVSVGCKLWQMSPSPSGLSHSEAILNKRSWLSIGYWVIYWTSVICPWIYLTMPVTSAISD